MILAVVNNKGGVGKTTCTVNLAHALAIKGKRVLVIDNDPQSNASALLLGDSTPEINIYNLYTDDKVKVESCIYPTSYGLDILPNVTKTAEIEFDLYQNKGSYNILKDSCRKYCDKNYDFILVDCPPTLGLWVAQAMILADAVIVPVEAGSRHSLDGLKSVYDSVQIMSNKVNTKLKFLRAIINKVDMRTSVSKLIVETMHRKYPNNTFVTTIPMNTSIQQAEAYRTTVLRHDSACASSKRFKSLADELIGIVDVKN